MVTSYQLFSLFFKKTSSVASRLPGSKIQRPYKTLCNLILFPTLWIMCFTLTSTPANVTSSLCSKHIVLQIVQAPTCPGLLHCTACVFCQNSCISIYLRGMISALFQIFSDTTFSVRPLLTIFYKIQTFWVSHNALACIIFLHSM